MSRILHLSPRREHLEFNKRQFAVLNYPGIAISKGDTVTMTNGDEHVWMVLGRGDQLRGTEWDCVIVDEDIRRCVADRDYRFMLELIPTRVRPK
jgi:hypothetical protein